MAGGTVSLLTGSLLYATYWNGGHFDEVGLAVAITLLMVGGVAEGLGGWQLIQRMQRRDELDEQLHALEASPDDGPAPPMPPAAKMSLPRVPLQLAFGWSF
jgi:hypothetical protein